MSAVNGAETVCAFGGIDWNVVACEGGCALLLACEPVCEHPFHDRKRCPEWAACELRTYLNGAFLQGFGLEERRAIRPALVPNGSSTRRTGNTVDTLDSAFLLSDGEVRSLDSGLRRASGRWWTRTPGADSYYIRHVEPYGAVSSFGSSAMSEGIGVRPAMWVSLADAAQVAPAVVRAAEALYADAGGLPPAEGPFRSDLPSAWAFAASDAACKVRVVAGYLARLDQGGCDSSLVMREYASRQGRRVFQAALGRSDAGDVLAGMLAEGLVTARNVDEFLSQATRMQDYSLMAMLLDYKATGLSAGDLAREERRRENEALRLVNPLSVAELKKVWKWRVQDGSAVLGSYTGSSPVVTVPANIGKLPVSGCECRFPFIASHLIVPDIPMDCPPFAGTVHGSGAFRCSNAAWVDGCCGFQKLEYGEGCEAPAYVAAARMRQREIGSLPVADQVRLYGGAVMGGIAWIPVRHRNGAWLLIAKDPVVRQPYNRARSGAGWHASSLRAWLNGDFLKSFTRAQRKLLLAVPLDRPQGVSLDAPEDDVAARVEAWFNRAGNLGEDGGDAAFVLSSREARFLLDDGQRRASGGWWLRDAGECPRSAAYMLADGRVFREGAYVNSPLLGVRPVILVSADEGEGGGCA